MSNQRTADEDLVDSDHTHQPERSGWTAVPVLGVRDVKKVAEYWRDVLGFDLDADHGVFGVEGDESGGVYAIVSRDGCVVHFQIRRGPQDERRREHIETDVYIHVDDVDRVYEELTRRGAAIWDPPSVAPYGQNEIRVEDCVGHRLTFGSPAEGR
ncbi:MAG: glyoxalase superfamily protein [Acidimicrobiales bacterium]